MIYKTLHSKAKDLTTLKNRGRIQFPRVLVVLDLNYTSYNWILPRVLVVLDLNYTSFNWILPRFFSGVRSQLHIF
jgi:hypothetical protein